MESEAEYTCDACGETIVIPVDLSQGAHQEYGEDCPVCCCPLLLTVEVDADGRSRVQARAE